MYGMFTWRVGGPVSYLTDACPLVLEWLISVRQAYKASTGKFNEDIK